ncbi:MAG: hypothetical protein K0Q59_504 [Paenibacillus sp.]|nr:hypothetical protein [Paenibacillus sp.]
MHDGLGIQKRHIDNALCVDVPLFAQCCVLHRVANSSSVI